MGGLGGLLIFLGLGSIALKLLSMFDIMHFEFTVLMWIDSWGDLVGWAIRGGAVALGLILIMASGGGKSDARNEA